MIRIIRKYRPDSIAEIKKDIENGYYILSCSYAGEPEKFNAIIQCYNELIGSGFSAELYEHGRRSTIELFNNWSNTMKEIREEIEAEDIDDGSDEYS
ncbi:MAG: hypothetical protein IKG46_05400 [Solobacterium sp.]|nr:hypothetical protein [Solobacterium sp.]